MLINEQPNKELWIPLIHSQNHQLLYQLMKTIKEIRSMNSRIQLKNQIEWTKLEYIIWLNFLKAKSKSKHKTKQCLSLKFQVFTLKNLKEFLKLNTSLWGLFFFKSWHKKTKNQKPTPRKLLEDPNHKVIMPYINIVHSNEAHIYLLSPFALHRQIECFLM